MPVFWYDPFLSFMIFYLPRSNFLSSPFVGVLPRFCSVVCLKKPAGKGRVFSVYVQRRNVNQILGEVHQEFVTSRQNWDYECTNESPTILLQHYKRMQLTHLIVMNTATTPARQHHKRTGKGCECWNCPSWCDSDTLPAVDG